MPVPKAQVKSANSTHDAKFSVDISTLLPVREKLNSKGVRVQNRIPNEQLFIVIVNKKGVRENRKYLPFKV
jgi:hypothetical protein